MIELRSAIAAIYAQVGAPEWAAPNLDGLADVLRDLSWLPEGPVRVVVPDRAPERLLTVLRRSELETAAGPRPILIRPERRSI